MMQEILDEIKRIYDLAAALLARVQDLVDTQTTVEIQVGQEVESSNGTDVIGFTLPENAIIIGYVLRDLGFNFAPREIYVTNISQKLDSGQMLVNLFLSQPAMENSYHGKISYYTPVP